MTNLVPALGSTSLGIVVGWLVLNALTGCNSKDRKQGSEQLCGPAHERLATKPSSCGWKVTV